MQGLVKKVQPPTQTSTGTKRSILVELNGQDVWYDMFDSVGVLFEGQEIDYDVRKNKNPKYNDTISKFIVVGEANAQPQRNDEVTKEVPATVTRTDDRQTSIVRQSTLGYTVNAYIAAGLFYEGMSRNEFKAAMKNCIEDSQLAFLHCTLQDQELENL